MNLHELDINITCENNSYKKWVEDDPPFLLDITPLPGVVLAQTTESFLWGFPDPESPRPRCSKPGLSRTEIFLRTGLSLPSLPPSPGSGEVKLWLGDITAGSEIRLMIRNQFKRKMFTNVTCHSLSSLCILHTAQNISITVTAVLSLSFTPWFPWSRVGCHPGESQI